MAVKRLCFGLRVPFFLSHCWNCWNKQLLQTTTQASILFSCATQGMSIWFSLKRLLIPFSAGNVKWWHLIAEDAEPQISCLMAFIRRKAPLEVVLLSRANLKCFFSPWCNYCRVHLLLMLWKSFQFPGRNWGVGQLFWGSVHVLWSLMSMVPDSGNHLLYITVITWNKNVKGFVISCSLLHYYSICHPFRNEFLSQREYWHSKERIKQGQNWA